MQQMHTHKQRSTLSFNASLICGIAILFYFFDYFIQASPSVMAQQFMHHFQINVRDLGILGACFYYSYLLMQIPAGILLDKFGARSMITSAIFICAVGVALVAHTNSFLVACLGRSLTGMGSAFSFIGAIYLIANWFSERYFASLLGLTQSGAALGSLLGLAPIAYGVSHIGWVRTLDIMCAATMMLGLLSLLCIRDHPNSPKYQSGTLDWNALYAILKNKQVWLIACLGFCSWTPVATIGTLWGVPFLVKVYHISTLQAGELCSVFWIGLGILSPSVGWIADRYQNKKQCMIIAFLVSATAAVCLLFLSQTNKFITSILLFTISAAPSVQALTFALIKDQVPKTSLGYASGLNNMAAVVGGAFAQTIVGILLYGSLKLHTHQLMAYPLHAYKYALSIMPLTLITGFIASLFLINKSANKEKPKPVDKATTIQTQQLNQTKDIPTKQKEHEPIY